MPIIYEVNVAVKASLSDKYLAWLKPHALEMYEHMKDTEEGGLEGGVESHTITLNYNVDRATVPRNVEKLLFGKSADFDANAGEGDYLMDTADWHLFTVRYVITSRDLLDLYMDEKAHLVRAAVQQAFTAEELETGIIAWRRTLNIVE